MAYLIHGPLLAHDAKENVQLLSRERVGALSFEISRVLNVDLFSETTTSLKVRAMMKRKKCGHIKEDSTLSPALGKSTT